MWATVALLTGLSLAPAQGGELRLTNERSTYGVLGPERKDDKVLPGDKYTLHFDIEGMKVSEDGKIRYSFAFEVLSDKDSKSVYKQQPQDLEALNSLGGGRVPGLVALDVGSEQPPGMYTLKVTVKDRGANKTKELTRKFELLPRDFGIVRVQTYMAPSQLGAPLVVAPPVGVPGQGLLFSFSVMGFDRDKAKKQPNLKMEMTIFDEEKKPTLPKPFLGEVTQDVPAEYQVLPMEFLVQLNRAGSFTVELKATDTITKKTSKVTLPLKVLDVTK